MKYTIEKNIPVPARGQGVYSGKYVDLKMALDSMKVGDRIIVPNKREKDNATGHLYNKGYSAVQRKASGGRYYVWKLERKGRRV